MTEVKATAQDAVAVKTHADVIDYYRGTQTNFLIPEAARTPKIGMEMEYTAFILGSLTPLGIEKGNALVLAGEKAGLQVHREPSSTLAEVITDPFSPENLERLLVQSEEKFRSLYALASEQETCLSPFGHLPHIGAQEHSVTKVPRYKAFWDPPRADMQDIYRSFLYPNIQTSISYRDWDHLLRIIRLCTALEPVMFLLTDASAGFFEGEPIDDCPWMKLKSRRGVNGGIPDFYYNRIFIIPRVRAKSSSKPISAIRWRPPIFSFISMAREN
jgi:hypothetical protein